MDTPPADRPRRPPTAFALGVAAAISAAATWWPDGGWPAWPALGAGVWALTRGLRRGEPALAGVGGLLGLAAALAAALKLAALGTLSHM